MTAVFLLVRDTEHRLTVGIELFAAEIPVGTGYGDLGRTCLTFSDQAMDRQVYEFVPVSLDRMHDVVRVKVYRTQSGESDREPQLIETVTVGKTQPVQLRHTGVNLSLRLLSIGQAPPDPAGASGTGSENDWAG